jgi:N utilization substance protein A
MDLKNFSSAISQIAEEKGISAERVIESIETAIAAAYKKDYGEKGQIVKAKLDQKTGKVKFWQIKTVVTEDMLYTEEEIEKLKERKEEKKEEKKDDEKIRFNEEKHIMLDQAKKIKKSIKVGEELEIDLVSKKDYGRIAAQTAKQVILQKIREAERDMVLEEYKSKEGEIVSGIVQRIEARNVFIDIGKTLGILPREEQVYGEFYKTGQRLKLYILKVDETLRGPVVILSRAYPKLVSKLFELEVPEISQEQVEIKSIAREAGSRSKIAVESLVPK